MGFEEPHECEENGALPCLHTGRYARGRSLDFRKSPTSSFAFTQVNVYNYMKIHLLDN